MHRPIFLYVITVLVFLGCATQKQTKKKVTRYEPEFDWTVPENARKDTHNITLAIIAPSYGNKILAETGAPYTTFLNSFKADFQELLSARGYNILGPFESYNVMTYPQRKRADLALIPTFDIQVSSSSVGFKEKIDLNLLVPSKYYYIARGSDRLSGQITLSAKEPLTDERMWFKNIDLDTKQFSWTSNIKLSKSQLSNIRYKEESKISKILLSKGDLGIYNPTAKILEKYYPYILKQTWTYLNPSQMKVLSEKAQKLKQKYSPE